MKTYITPDGEGIDSLKMVDSAEPGPLGSAQVRVAVKAVSLNYRDLLVLRGALGRPGPEGLIMCSDGAGEVVEVAADVQRVAVGDRVAMTFIPDWIAGPFRTVKLPFSRGFPLQGVMREQLAVSENELVVLPDHLSYEDAACLPCAGVTAWHALCGAAPLYPGMSVLLQGAGGVSTLALQFARVFGARVIVTSSSQARCEQLQALGADATINYHEVQDWEHAVRELTGGEGVDLAVDLGGAATVERSIAATRKGGRVALVGLLGGWPQSMPSPFAARADVTPVTVGSRDDFEMMNRAIDFHQLHPVIDRRFSFSELPEALRYLESGRQFGKIVISFQDLS